MNIERRLPGSDSRAQGSQTLPPGHTVGGAWGFHDPGGLAYEFFRVYGPPHGSGDREFSRLDEARSYWAVSVPVFEPDRDVRLTEYSLSYGEALKLVPSRLTFRRFSSPLDMRDVVPQLLGIPSR